MTGQSVSYPSSPIKRKKKSREERGHTFLGSFASVALPRPRHQDTQPRWLSETEPDNSGSAVRGRASVGSEVRPPVAPRVTPSRPHLSLGAWPAPRRLSNGACACSRPGAPRGGAAGSGRRPRPARGGVGPPPGAAGGDKSGCRPAPRRPTPPPWSSAAPAPACGSCWDTSAGPRPRPLYPLFAPASPPGPERGWCRRWRG